MITEAMIRGLQDVPRWGAHADTYTPEFHVDPRAHRDATHAVIHLWKAGGKLARLRHGHLIERPAAANALADVVICALRAADTWPGGVRDLASRVVTPPTKLSWQKFSSYTFDLMDALGMLAGLLDDLEHTDTKIVPEDIATTLAAVVTATAGIAWNWPSGPIDLEAVTHARLAAQGLGAPTVVGA
jgi:hypothetical protein